MQRGAEQVVGGAERGVAEGSFEQREVLEVRVFVAADVVECDEREEPFDLDFPCGAILPEEASEFFVAAVVFVVNNSGSPKAATVGALADRGRVEMRRSRLCNTPSFYAAFG